METSSARPYYAVFAILAIAIAGFFLKQQIAAAATSEAATSPARQIVDQVPEKYPAWFKRVDFAKLGFQSQADEDRALTMIEIKRGIKELSPDQEKQLHDMIASKELIQHQVGMDLLSRINGPLVEKFVPDVKAMYTPGGRNQEFKTMLSIWYSRGSEDVV
jgi:hypothetical protein